MSVLRVFLTATTLLCAPALANAACPATPTDCPNPTYRSALIGPASGGNKGSGSLNAQSLWINGTALGSGGGGLPNVSGTPASGNLTRFSSAISITNGDLTGDTTTGGTLVTTTGKVHGVTFPATPSTNTVPVVTSTNTVTYEAVPNAALANSAMTIGGQAISLGGTTTNQGTGGKLQLSTGSTTTNNCVKFDASGNTADAGIPCTAGSVTSVDGSSSGGTLTATGGPITSTGTLNFDLNLSHANLWAAVQTFTNSDLKLLGSSTGATTFTSANSSATDYTATFPANTGTLAELNLAQTWVAPQTFTNSDILLLGSSTGATTFASANAGATNYTTTFPANTGTLAELNLAQTWLAPQTFTNSDILLLGSSTGATTFASANSSATNYTATLPANTGTIAELNLTQTWLAPQTFTNSDFKLLGSSTGRTTFTSANTGASDFVLTVPDNTGTMAELNLAQTWTAIQTFTNSDFKLLGSSTGATTLASANAGATNYTATLPANTGTMAELNLAQTWTDVQTFTNSDLVLLGSSTGTTAFTSANASATNYTATLPANTGTLSELNLAQTFTATQSVSVETVSAATSTLTPSGAKNDYTVTLVHANQPFTLANMTSVPPMDTRGIIKIVQSSTGGDAITTYGASYKSPGGTSTITLSSGANAIDIFDYVSDGTSVFLIPHLNFSH